MNGQTNSGHGSGDGRALGIGLYEVSYYAGIDYFNDIASAMSGWLSFDLAMPGAFSDDRAVALDENGFPVLAEGQGARSLIRIADPVDGVETYAPGTYTLTWEGEADLEIAVNGETYRFDDSDDQIAENRASIEVPAGLGELTILLSVYEQGDDPLSDVGFYLPGTDAGSGRFSDSFLNLIAPFDEIRLMDWNLTNFGGSSGLWDDRAQLDWASWGVEDTGTDDSRAFAQGVPYEVMIELANEADTDIWITIPHLADDGYVRALAELLEAELEPGRTVTVEYSNEIWNGIFPVADDLDASARERNTAAGLDPEEDDNAANRFTVAAEEIVSMAETFHAIFADDSRFEIVVAGQAGWEVPLTAILNEIDRLGAMDLIDKAAVAPYFPDYEFSPVLEILDDALADGRVSEAEYGAIFDGILAEIEAMFAGTSDVGRELAGNLAVADRFGLPLVTYEAGQHFTSGELPDDLVEAFADQMLTFQSRPEWAEIYEAYLDGWEAYAGTTMTLYHLVGAWNRQEAFGHLRHGLEGPGDSSKFDALLSWLEAAPGPDTAPPPDLEPDPDPTRTRSPTPIRCPSRNPSPRTRARTGAEPEPSRSRSRNPTRVSTIWPSSWTAS